MTVSSTQNSAQMAAIAAQSSANSNSSSSSSANSTLSFTSNFNTFLTLLTTQLQNQDPLSPMDTNTFTQQLVSFSGVEQQIDTNNNLQSLIQLQSAGETISSLPLVGDQIQYNSATAPLQNGQANFSYTLPANSSTTELAVTNSSGDVIYSTAGNTQAGTYSFNWNGETNSGQQMPDGGAYTLEVVSKDSTGNAITATVNSIGTVSSVAVNNSTPTFDVDGVSVPMSELVTVNPGKSSTTSTN